MNVILFGSTGLVGSAVRRACEMQDLSVLAPRSSELNLRHISAIRDAIHGWASRFPEAVVVNCAAMANVDQVERQPDVAHDVNVMAPMVMAETCDAAGLRFIHISTDQVFGNYPISSHYRHHEDDLVLDPRWPPVNEYGRQKQRAEQYIGVHPQHVIVRTQWVYGPGRPTWVDSVTRQARSNEPITALTDYYGIPTSATDLACGVTRLILDPDARGVFHLVNQGDPICRADLAAWILAECRLNGTIVRCQMNDMASIWAARRPSWSIIKNFRSDALPLWTESLAAHLRNGH